MSGAVAAHAAYNGSGTQGLAVTNNPPPEMPHMSVFWNKNDWTQQSLYGSSIIEIPASGSGGSLSSGGNQIFTVNNDIDALGDLYLQISTTGHSGLSFDLKPFDLLNCIKRIEFMVGTQVWQTLEPNDIKALNMTEMSEDVFESFFLGMSGGFGTNGLRNKVRIADTAYTRVDSDVSGILRLPALCRSLGPKFSKFTDVKEHCYLLAGAPHQSVKIRVYMATSLPNSSLNNFTLKLFGQCIVMCNDERELMKSIEIPKRLKMTQNHTSTFAPSGGLVGGKRIIPCALDLDHFSLFTSHIILAVTPTITGINSSIKDVELKLNSSSFSGTLKGALLTGSVSDTLGLYSNSIFMAGANYANNYYVFPLASKAYGGSAVPLNRFDNIRMDVQVVLENTDVRRSTTDLANLQTNFTLSATCVGETTALYKGGAASLAMY